jgi:hypothetical protein
MFLEDGRERALRPWPLYRTWVEATELLCVSLHLGEAAVVGKAALAMATAAGDNVAVARLQVCAFVVRTHQEEQDRDAASTDTAPSGSVIINCEDAWPLLQLTAGTLAMVKPGAGPPATAATRSCVSAEEGVAELSSVAAQVWLHVVAYQRTALASWAPEEAERLRAALDAVRLTCSRSLHNSQPC